MFVVVLTGNMFCSSLNISNSLVHRACLSGVHTISARCHRIIWRNDSSPTNCSLQPQVARRGSMTLWRCDASTMTAWRRDTMSQWCLRVAINQITPFHVTLRVIFTLGSVYVYILVSFVFFVELSLWLQSRSSSLIIVGWGSLLCFVRMSIRT